MQKNTLRIVGNKAVLNIRERMCETAEELLASDKFRAVIDHSINHLKGKNSHFWGYLTGIQMRQLLMIW
jgi:hypothetical protein